MVKVTRVNTRVSIEISEYEAATIITFLCLLRFDFFRKQHNTLRGHKSFCSPTCERT